MKRRILAGIGLAAVCFVLLPWAVSSLWQPRELPSERFLARVKVGMTKEQVESLLLAKDIEPYYDRDLHVLALEDVFTFASDNTVITVQYDDQENVYFVECREQIKTQPFWQKVWEYFFPPEPLVFGAGFLP